MAFVCCNTVIHAKKEDNAGKGKDSTEVPKTFEDRVVTAADYVHDTLRQFYNGRWEPCASTFAYYYSVAYKKEGSWICYDYYIPENKIFHYATYTDQELKNKQGLFISYTSKGALDAFGQYDRNKKTGDWLLYTEGREIPDTVMYYNDMPSGRSVRHYADGNILSVQEMDTLGEGTGRRSDYYDYEKGIIKETALYTRGMKKDSTWVYFHPNGKVSFMEQYDKDSLQSISCYDINGVSLDTCITEQPAEFAGGLPGLMKFLSKHIRYPDAAREDGVSGRVYAQFTVEEDGAIANITIKRDMGFGFGEEARRVVSLMPKWKPGKRYGNPVRTYYTLPVTFRLN